MGAVIGAAVGIVGFITLVGGSGEASEPISAPTLDINAVPTLNPTQAFDAVTQVAQLSSQVADLQATIEGMNAEAAPTEIPSEPTDTPPIDEPAAGSLGRAQYRIDPQSSQVSFILEEDLRGTRTTVIGTTNEVAGDIIIDYDNPASSQIGTIRINARTLQTDNSFRNRALRSNILLSSQDQYEFIEFVPTALNGLPESAAIGETYTIEIVGDLTIIGNTREVMFTTEVTLDSETQISGSATTSVLYADWGISIPDAPGVSNVTDDVTLTIDFVANQVVE